VFETAGGINRDRRDRSVIAIGRRKHQVDQDDGDILTCSDDGKVTFHPGCGRGFALHVRYPGEADIGGKKPFSAPANRYRRLARDVRSL
jgi:hypothetical protein